MNTKLKKEKKKKGKKKKVRRAVLCNEVVTGGLVLFVEVISEEGGFWGQHEVI